MTLSHLSHFCFLTLKWSLYKLFLQICLHLYGNSPSSCSSFLTHRDWPSVRPGRVKAQFLFLTSVNCFLLFFSLQPLTLVVFQCQHSRIKTRRFHDSASAPPPYKQIYRSNRLSHLKVSHLLVFVFKADCWQYYFKYLLIDLSGQWEIYSV